jgi:SAM-dependent methyltransferase
MQYIFKEDYLLTPYKSFKIELKSFVLSKFFFFYYNFFFKTEKKYLNIGSGEEVKKWCLNLDFFRIDFWNAKYLVADIRKKLFFKDRSFKGVYSSHTLEHLTPNDSLKLLREIYRILLPGGVVRICVPDIEQYCKFYFNKKFSTINKFRQIYKKGYVAMWNNFQNNHHLSCYDFECLKMFLKKAGFNNIRKLRYSRSQDQLLSRLDKYSRSWNSLYVEGTKIKS